MRWSRLVWDLLGNRLIFKFYEINQLIFITYSLHSLLIVLFPKLNYSLLIVLFELISWE